MLDWDVIGADRFSEDPKRCLLEVSSGKVESLRIVMDEGETVVLIRKTIYYRFLDKGVACIILLLILIGVGLMNFSLLIKGCPCK